MIESDGSSERNIRLFEEYGLEQNSNQMTNKGYSNETKGPLTLKVLILSINMSKQQSVSGQDGPLTG